MKSKSRYTLGVMVTERLVRAVLLQPGPDGPQPVRHFTRQRTSHVAGGAAMGAGAEAFGGLPGGQAELEEGGSGDFTIQFGEGSGGGANNLFLASEFAGMEAPVAATGEAPPQTSDCALELGDILAECRDAGYEDPLLAFAIPSADVSHVELRVVEKKGKRKAARKGDQPEDAAEAPKAALPGRAQLLALLAEQEQAEVDPDRVAFVPMTSGEDGAQRVLALFPKREDDVTATLKVMRKQKGQRPPSVRLLDTEAALYLGLARAARRADVSEGAEPEEEHTLVVRVGAEDTLVMFLEGDALRHHDSLRSLTSHDAPETICSRVLLQQDEHGVGEVQRVLLLSDEQERGLRSSFETFFPAARVASLRRGLPGAEGDVLDASDGASMVPAAGAALRLAGGAPHEDVFEDVNLLPRQLLRQRIQLPITWHSLALGLLLFGTTLFFVARFFSLQGEIGDARERLRSYPPELDEANVQVLQARIDSLERAYSGYMRALDVVDSLLVGSDRWSRALEKTSRETAAVGGVWIDGWRPIDGGVRVAGHATARDRVVRFADRMRGDIETLSFAEIREWPVYAFSMFIPMKDRLPEAATYLRERVALAEDGAGSPAAGAASEGAPVTRASLKTD